MNKFAKPRTLLPQCLSLFPLFDKLILSHFQNAFAQISFVFFLLWGVSRPSPFPLHLFNWTFPPCVIECVFLIVIKKTTLSYFSFYCTRGWAVSSEASQHWLFSAEHSPPVSSFSPQCWAVIIAQSTIHTTDDTLQYLLLLVWPEL